MENKTLLAMQTRFHATLLPEKHSKIYTVACIAFSEWPQGELQEHKLVKHRVATTIHKS